MRTFLGFMFWMFGIVKVNSLWIGLGIDKIDEMS